MGHVGGRIERNPYRMADPAAPEDVSIYDDLPIVWSLWADTEGSTDREAEQRRRARAVFDLVATDLRWPCILVHDFEELIATYDPERGVREFPPRYPRRRHRTRPLGVIAEVRHARASVWEARRARSAGDASR